MKKLICMACMVLLVLLSNVADIGNMRAYAGWETGTGTWTCTGSLINHNFTATKSTYVFKGNCVWGGGETANPNVPYEITAEWDLQAKTATEYIRGYNYWGKTVASCSNDPWLNDGINCSEVSLNSNVSPESLYVTVPDWWLTFWRDHQALGLPLTRNWIDSAQKRNLSAQRAEQDWRNSDVVMGMVSSYSSPDQVFVKAHVVSSHPLPYEALMEFEIAENFWPVTPRPIIYKTEWQINRNDGTVFQPFKTLCPGTWYIHARIKGSQRGWTSDFKFNVGGAPKNLKAELTGIQYCEHRNVKLTWQAPASIQFGFYIERAVEGGSGSTFIQIGSVDGNKREYIDTGDKFGGYYYSYRVKAQYDSALQFGYTSPAGIWLDPVKKPSAPTNLRSASGSQVGLNAPIKLSWKDNSTDETKFLIYRRDPGSTEFKHKGETGPNIQEFTDTSSKSAGTYTYRINARNRDCFSPDSNLLTIQVYTQLPPPPPPKPPHGIK